MKRFEDLDAWKTSRQLANQIYDVTHEDLFARDFGLRDQIQRAAVSVMSDIAEGFNSRTQRIFIDLLGRARGSAAEVQSQLYIAVDQEYISQDHFDTTYDLAEKASRQIHSLIKYLEPRPNASRLREGRTAYRIDFSRGEE